MVMKYYFNSLVRRLFFRPEILLSLILSLFFLPVSGQVGFMVDDVVLNLTSPTSLEFGPDGRLYVAQQNGTLTVYSISRTGLGNYQVDSFETILTVKDSVPNHNDDGTLNTTQKRQITGIMTAGTSANPVLYVTSSDWRIKVGEDGNLDTNSGVISRLTWVGTGIGDPAGYWDRVDIVRGLPRSEENHATNGMDLDVVNNILYVMNGGNCNKGAPSNNFGGTPEYALSAALLSIDLDSIENMPVFVDSRTNTKFVYDLPTLDDPGRVNIDNTHPEFPYSASHPYYNDTIDLGDPFGGNNGLNQAMWVENGPVQVYSPGYRNAYDVVFTSNGRLYTFDNGPNGGWGGLPLIYDSAGVSKGVGPWVLGDYSTNELQESSSSAHGDGLHFINAQGYYGGYPNPTRANPDKAGLYYYVQVGGSWVVDSVYDFMNDFPEPPVPLTLANPIESDYQAPSAAMLLINSSTNGITEYTASNFGGALQGNLLAVSFNDNVYNIELNGAGDAVVNSSAMLNGFGNNPLDITTQGDGDIFPGTIWVALHGDDKITVFEPNDYSPVACDSTYSTAIDSDGDGFSNADELDNGTDPCSQGSKPQDYDGDFISNLNDDDDDNDGLLDTYDPFAVDSTNGLTTNLPVSYGFSINGNDAIPGTLFGLGFTGVMTNGDPAGPTPGDDYQALYDEDSLNLGGATSKFGIENIDQGDAFEAVNTQHNGFQFGINIDTASNPFTIVTRVESPFFLVGGAPIQPINGQSKGLMAGPGNQDNYVKIVMNAQSGSGGIGVTVEINGVASSTDFDTTVVGDILSATAVDLYLAIDPGNQTVQPKVSIDGGATIINLGSPLALPPAWFDLSDSLGFAVGIISTSGGSGQKFDATWDFINVLNASPVAYGIPDQQGVEGQPNDTLNLLSYFDDDEGGINLAFAIESNTNTLVGALVAGNELILTYLGSGTGSDTVVVRATDTDGNFVLDTFVVTVLEPISVYYRVNAGGSLVAALDPPKSDWEEDSPGSPSGYHNAGSNTNGYAIVTTDGSVPASTPISIFQSERWDPKTNPNMEWDFPAPVNGDYEIRLYFADGYSGTSTPGKRIFSVEIEGNVVLNNYDIVADVGHMTGTMKSFVQSVSDGNIDINFLQGSKSVPIINGIEILGGGVPGGNTRVLAATATSVHFFSTEVDSTSAPIPDTLFNSGNSTLTVSAVNITGSDAGMFSHDLVPPFNIDSGAIYPFNISFSPTSIGSKSASLELVHSGDNASPFIIALTGEAISSVNQPPVSNLGNQSDTINSVINIAGNSYASDPEGDDMTFSATGLGALGLSIDPATGDITGLLTSATGDYAVSIKIVDNGVPADSTTENLVWSVTLELDTGQWVQELSSDSSSLVERGENDYVELDGKFYLIGGRGTLAVSIYDPITKTWSTGAAPPMQLHHFQAIGYNSKIYILGGMTGSYPNESPVDSIYIYDPVLDIWDAIDEIPVARRRGSGGAVVYNNEFYLMAGITNGHISGHVNWADKYNPGTGVWTILNDAPRPRDHFKAVEANGKIYLAGGRLSKANDGSVYANTIGAVDVYDIGTNTWTTLSDSLPTKRAGAMSVFYQGRIMVIGGESDAQTVAHNEVEGLDPNTETWQTLPAMLTGRHGTGAVVLNNRVYVAGGVGNRGGNPKLTSQEYYSVASNPIFPVTFLAFEANVNPFQEVEVDWVGMLNGTTSQFVVERSRDISFFETIAVVGVSDNLTGLQEYSIVDKDPLGGTSYYRIREVGIDGSISYSEIRSVYITSQQISLYPNPLGDERILFVNGHFPEGAVLRIFDGRGKTLISEALEKHPQPATHKVPLRVLAKGLYFVSIIVSDQVITKKIILE